LGFSLQEFMLHSRFCSRLWRILTLAVAFGVLTNRCPSTYYRTPTPMLSVSPEVAVHQRLIFIGDAGEMRTGSTPDGRSSEPALQLLDHWAGLLPERTTVIFLGDNVYPGGTPADPMHPSELDAIQRLTAQTNIIARSGARALFVPGNHDWKTGEVGILRQEQLIRKELGVRGSYLPNSDSPVIGVTTVGWVRIIALDTETWVNPPSGTVPCSVSGLEKAMSRLSALLSQADLPVVVVAHHPLLTYGTHGGTTLLKNTINWITRKPNTQDITAPEYRCMRSVLSETLAKSPPLVYAAGHDHDLQILDAGNVAGVFLVSGAGSYSKTLWDIPPIRRRVRHGPETRFAHTRAAGFIILDVLENGQAELGVVTAQGRSAEGTLRWRGPIFQVGDR
jgi:hypothetical protein